MTDMSELTSLPVRHILTLEGTLDTAHVITAPNGLRVAVAVREGTIRGERINGAVAPGVGGDFPLFRPDGSLRLDVRLVIITDDGVRIYVTYLGVGVPDASGGLTLRTAPTFEAPEGNYAWLNNVQAIGLGNSSPATGELRYDIYEVT
jgi:hypothetical protein